MTKMLFDSKCIIFLLCSLLFPSVYNEGDAVSLMHQNQSFQVCSGEYYKESVSLADFNGDLNGGHNTVILIDMSASWWQYCPDLQTQVGLVEEHYEDNPNVIVITALSDIGQPYSCNQWNNFSPNVTALIIEDNNSIFNWFNSQNGFPSTVFIDENMTVQYKANYLNSYYMKGYIDDLLGDCGDDCVSEPSPALFEYAIDGLTVSFIDLSQDINVSVITDWHWDFGDGIESTQQFPEHTYSNSGTYYVVLNIVDQYGADGLEYWEYITLESDDSCGADAGDVTGDGSLNILDIVQVANYILGVSIPDFECAADLNNDENVNILDIVQIANAILDR